MGGVVERIANIFQETKEKGNTTLPFLTVSIHSGVSDKELSDNELDRKVLRNKDPSQNIRVRKNDLVYNMMRAWQGGLGTVKVDGMVSPAYVIASPIETKVQTKYFELLLRIPNGIVELKKYSKGIIDFRLRLYWRDFKRINLLVPTYDTQTKIATYLDQKTQTIDKEITLLEQKTAKYKELKQTLINETVLRGLDRAVKLKESEIEWIGEIPEGWEVKRLKDLGKTETSSVDKKIRDGEDIVKIVNYIDVYNNGNRELYNSDNYMLVSANSLQKRTKHLKKGDMLFTPTSETIEDIGISAIVLQDLENTLYSYHLLRLNFYIVIDNKFKKYLFNNQYVQSYFSKSAKSSTRKILGLTVFDNLRVAIPPKREQTQIANYLDEKTQKIDNIIETIQTKIALLKEFRKTLINDVVTGRVKVA